MPLDPNYVPLTPLWEVHTDKDTGDFLRNGFALFYRDTARNVGKPVYELTGSPPNYSYIQQGFLVPSGPFADAWRVNLNDQGAFPLMVYGYPLDSNGDLDLYFIQFYNADGIFQFSREGWPNFFTASGGNTTQINVNYIPNGQFLLHTDIPATDTLDVGEIRQAVTQIAYGGFTFERPNSSTARDFVTFQRIGSYLTNPSKSPRYAARVKCENPTSGDLFKDIRIRFDDVNKFEYLAQKLTFSFSGQVMSGGNFSVDLILIKNFGTGGDTTTETNIATFNLTSSFSLNFVSFDFGDNTGKIIGSNDDDYIQLALRFPTNGIFDGEVTDWILTPGDVTNPVFDDTTTRQFIYRSLFSELLPAYDGSSLGLAPVLWEDGLSFDDSQIGNIVARTTPDVPRGYLETDGKQYETAAYSSDGIPFSRLQKFLLNRPNGEIIPRYGTGKDFVTANFINYTMPPAPATDTMFIVNNKTGAVTDFSDGAVPTGFTFHNVSSGSIDTSLVGFYTNVGDFIIWGKVAGAPFASINAGTSGFTVSQARDFPQTKSLAVVSATVAAAGLAGKYFQVSNTTTTFYIWFKVDGTGTDPAPGGTGIEVDLLSTWDAYTVAKILVSVVSGLKITAITAVAGSSVPAGSYFNINTQAQEYYVWFKKDNSGTDPAPSGKKPILANISFSYTSAQVSGSTLLAINSKYFAVPDTRGMFLRGWDNGANIDLNKDGRISNFSSLTVGDTPGSLELDDNLAHNHTFDTASFIDRGTPNGSDFLSSQFNASTGTTSTSGDEESRPINMYVNYLIKY